MQLQRKRTQYSGEVANTKEYLQTKEEARKHKKQKPEQSDAGSMLLDGEGRDVRILGLMNSQQISFLKLLLLYGAGDGSWTHFPLSSSLKTKKFENIAAYGDLVLRHLVEPQDESAHCFLDGVPKEGLQVKDTLKRLAKLYLIQLKDPSVLPFQIEDGGSTDLTLLWNDSQSVWKKEHDRLLLIGVLRHGYGKWQSIILDTEMGLLDVAQEELRRIDSEAETTEEKKEFPISLTFTISSKSALH